MRAGGPGLLSALEDAGIMPMIWEVGGCEGARGKAPESTRGGDRWEERGTVERETHSPSYLWRPEQCQTLDASASAEFL